MLQQSQSRPSWVDDDGLDAALVARIADGLSAYLKDKRIPDSACASGLCIEAATIFQRFHFSFDPIYWDDRGFPEVVAKFVMDIIAILERNPTWINQRYVAGVEVLEDLLRREQIESGPIR